MPIFIYYSLAIFLILFILFEVIPLAGKRRWKQLIVPVLFFGLTTLYGLDYALMSNILPNPNKTLYCLKPISDYLVGILQINV